jgi:hypothetical protein
MTKLWTDDARPGMRFREVAKHGDGVRCGDRVRVGDDEERRRRLRDSPVRIRSEPRRALIRDHGHALDDGAAEVVDDDELLHLRDQRLQGARQLRHRVVDHDDGCNAHHRTLDLDMRRSVVSDGRAGKAHAA